MVQATDSPVDSCGSPVDLTARTRELVGALYAVAHRAKHLGGGDPADQAGLYLLGHLVTPDAPLRISDLAGRCGLDLSTVSRHVRTLAERGYVARGEDPGDRRAAVLALTPSGRAALDAAQARRAAAFAAHLTHWSGQDLDRLTALLHRLAADLDATTTPEETR